MRLEAGIEACPIQCQRIEGCEHTDVGNDRSIVLRVAVTVRGYVQHHVNLEARAILNNRLGVLCNLSVQYVVGVVFLRDGCILGTR